MGKGSWRRWSMMGVMATTAWMASSGCGVLNPALLGTVGGSSVTGMEPPRGTILILVRNLSNAAAAARLELVKENGGVLSLAVPVQAFQDDPTDRTDRATIVQDCDVEQIQLLEVLAASPDGEIQQVAVDRPPLLHGVEFSCGRVVVISIVGIAPNLFIEIGVF